MPFIGLTGGLGTGKTTVLRLFHRLGAYTINADDIVSDILKTPEIIKKISTILGPGILAKKSSKPSIDKKRMADMIFSDSRKRRAVEKIIHPEVIKSAESMKQKLSSGKPDAFIVFEIPLLFEAGYSNFFDKVIVVYCSRTTALERLRKRGLPREQALKRMRAQMPLSSKKSESDFLISNTASVSDTKRQVLSIYKKLSRDI